MIFSLGEAALEAMAAAVNQWPSPIAGNSLELPFLGSVLRVRLPAEGEGTVLKNDRMRNFHFLKKNGLKFSEFFWF